MAEGDADNKYFLIQDNHININTVPDFELKSSDDIRLKAEDSKGLTVEKQFSLDVNDVVERIISLPANQSFQRGQDITIPILIDDTSGLFSFDIVLSFPSELFGESEDLPIVVPGSSLPLGWNLTANLKAQEGKIILSGYSANPMLGGSGTIAELQLTVNHVADLGQAPLSFNSVNLNEGKYATEIKNGVITIRPSSFQVLDVRELPNGLALKLSEAPNLDVFNLYDGSDTSQDPADLRLTDGSGNAVALSAHWQASTQELFLLASAPLQADSYNLVIDSRGDGLVSALKGEMLDGNGDGTNGDPFSHTYAFQRPEYSLSIADTARGAGQELSINGSGYFDAITGVPHGPAKGLPINLTTAKALRSLRGTFKYDSQFLFNSQWVAGADLPDDWTISVTPMGQPGEFQFQASGKTSIQGSDLELFRLKGHITPNALPGSSSQSGHVLYASTTLIEATLSSDQLTGEVFDVDPGLIALAYSGDDR